MEPLHERFRRLRLEREFSVKEFAKQIGVAESTYREWEYGRALVGPPFIKMAEVLKIPISTLLTGKTVDTQWILDELRSFEEQLAKLRGNASARL